jgi:MFS family permease
MDDRRYTACEMGEDPKETTHLIPPAERFRSIDEFLDDAYFSSTVPLRYYLTVLSISIANASFSASTLLISYLLADDDFVASIMLHDATWRGSLLAASVFAGMLLGGVCAGALCDHVGRHPVLVLSLAANVVAGLATAIAPNAMVLTFIRFLAGVAIGSTEPATFTLITEMSPPARRGLLVTFVASFWMVGNLHIAVAGLVVFQWFQWSWRIYCILCAIINVVALLMVWLFVPESPRFLAAVKGNHEDAVRITNVIGKQMVGGGTHQLKPYLIEELLHQYGRPCQVSTGNGKGAGTLRPTNNNAWAALSQALRNTTQLYTSELKWGTTLPTQALWFCVAIGSYFIMTWINSIFASVHLENIYVNLVIFALASLPGNIVSFLVVDRIGRLPMLVWSLVFSAAANVTFAWYVRNDSENVNTMAIVLSACAFQAFESGAWNALDVMTGEIFPTKVRSTAIGVCTATGRVAAMISQVSTSY